MIPFAKCCGNAEKEGNVRERERKTLGGRVTFELDLEGLIKVGVDFVRKLLPGRANRICSGSKSRSRKGRFSVMSAWGKRWQGPDGAERSCNLGPKEASRESRCFPKCGSRISGRCSAREQALV